MHIRSLLGQLISLQWGSPHAISHSVEGVNTIAIQCASDCGIVSMDSDTIYPEFESCCCSSQEQLNKVVHLLDRALRHRFEPREKCPCPASDPVHERLTASKNENTETEQTEKNDSYRLLRREEAPEYLQFNPFILTGYRGYLNTKLCIESVFWWTNETLNIWTHLFGLALFFCLTVYDFYLLDIEATLEDKFIVALLLFCFQICMFLSSVYHTFSCKSEKEYNCLLSFDLFGISLALFSIYMSGIYYAFWCDKELQLFYLITVTVIFIIAMVLQIPKLEISSNMKMLVFVLWAAYGVIPSLHWIGRRGGFNNPLVMLLLPRVVGMYCISGLAFTLYLTRIPERFYPGYVDYIGHSHQWWHFFVVVALYYWHNTGMIYVDYRINHACPHNLKIH